MHSLDASLLASCVPSTRNVMEGPLLMENDSESIDISSLKRAVLRPLQSAHEQPDSQLSLFAQREFAAVDTTLAQLSPRRPAQQHTTVASPNLDSLPELGSTVAESDVLNVDSQPVSEPTPTNAKSKSAASVRKMTSQGSDDPTQELSQSLYTTLLQNRSRSEVQLPTDQNGEEAEGESQKSLHEGMEGHIDLLSSYPKDGEEEADSSPVDFSPTQSQHALSQFPESQRFKTPATAGKKRRYDGAIIESPDLPRNPLLRNGTENHANVIGLSQAFAATQANTSPFLPDVNGMLPSDRPSPSIELQPRPMTAVSSSPMRPIYAFQRASTEPASRYVSVREEQAERDRQALARRQEILDTDDFSDDGLGLEPSPVARDRRQREIELRLQAKMQRLSSPSRHSKRGPSMSKSSPIRPPTRASPLDNHSARSTRFLDRSSPSRRKRRIASDDSEEETEQEDNADIAVARSSQALVPLDEEDKENFLGNGSQVPETTARLIRITNGPLGLLEDSPSLRHGRPIDADNQMPVLHSSQFFAVADSQASQTRRTVQKAARVLDSSPVDKVIDFVPQSPTSPPRQNEPADQVNGVKHADKLAPPDTLLLASPGLPLGSSSSQDQQHRRSTIPETSSNEQQSSSKATTVHHDEGHRPGEDSSRSRFETARSRIPSSTEALDRQAAVDPSVPPESSTPTTRKRQRMLDIAAEPSPLKSQVSFNATEALQVDADFQSPGRRTLLLRTPDSSQSKTARRRPSSPVRARFEDERIDQPVGGGNRQQGPLNTRAPASHPPNSRGTVPATGLAISSSKLSRKTPKSISVVAEMANTNGQAAANTNRLSQWELDASPPTKPAPVSKPGLSLKRKAKELDSSRGEEANISTKRQRRPTEKAAQSMAISINADNGAEKPSAHVPPKEDRRAQTIQMVEPDLDTSLVAPNMVFACFNGKTRAYYPALCLGPSLTDPARYLIQWEGYAAEEIDEYGIKSLDLRVGDQVKVNMQGFPKLSYVIKGFKDKIGQRAAVDDVQPTTDIRGYKTLLVAPKQRKSLPAEVSTELVKDVPVSSIYLDSNMWGQMKDRPYEYKPLVHKVSPFGSSTPVERSSTPSTPPSRNRRGATVAVPVTVSINLADGIFTNMAFAVTYKSATRRTKLEHLIRSQGGLVLQGSFLDLLESESTELKPQFSGLAFTALLTDKHSRKIKYMQALALGVPCLSGRWIEACCQADDLLDWTTYLLPAGETTELDGATKSRILPFGQALGALKAKDMFALRPNVFNGSRVIVVTGRKTSEERKEYLLLIRALGAGQIETEPDLNAAKATVERSCSDDGSEALRWVFVDNLDVDAAKTMFTSSGFGEKGRKKARFTKSEERPAPGMDVKVMCNEDIVQTLILGKLWMG
ncbi:DNA repair protein RAD9 [Exophiala viscosa]|uniref:DNA repair protein RAD9 n=1 Tax=Exophiala viscosa TaxID=2486360 RepID=A0AAN6E1K5_9EURO|nr:DNA repair protein RAD9 [Exophiala viscosa]